MPDATAPPSRARALTVLFITTLAFAVCFAAWMMFGVTGIPIRKALHLNASQFGLLTATLLALAVHLAQGLVVGHYGPPWVV